MQDLKVIGVEDGALVAATENGDRFRIAINDVLLSHLRPPRAKSHDAPKLSPREIQAHIRAGMSADEVAAVTGASVEDVRRFEGPVLAEREHIVDAALSVPVLATLDLPDGEEPTFGAAIAARLESLSATGERWTSWKEPTGEWIVKLSFAAADVDHDARWTFDQKKHTLAPQNREAVTLSKQGDLAQGLIPRLRAVERDGAREETPPEHDESRFDSGAFRFREQHDDDHQAPVIEPTTFVRQSSPAASEAAVNRAHPSEGGVTNQTADLLEALRKRRGQREAAPVLDEHDAQDDAPLHITGVDALIEEESPSTGDAADADRPPRRKESASRAKRGRTAMPSWDEIVFGARTDPED